jgi:hypothetical protein
MNVRRQVMLVGLLVAGAGAVEAQTSRVHLGPHVAYNFDLEDFAIGAQLSIPIATRLEFYPSFDYYFVDPGSAWGMNADLKYRFSGEQLNWLYVGGGINFTGIDVGPADDTNVGLNLIAGFETLRGRIHPFAEARAVLSDGSFLQLAVGLNFTLGQH